MKTLFIAATLLIAVDYALIGWFFLGRLWLPRSTSRRWAYMAFLCLVLFFFGCVHTHLDIILLGVGDDEHEHWYSWWNVTSHIVQGLAGLGFWVLAKTVLTINIYDRQAYQSAGDGDTERRLQYLALRAGLVRR
jgi:hypothetical protein